MKKILVPVDFSPNSTNALYVAADIAQRTGAVLELLHVNLAAAYAAPLSEYAAAPSGYGMDDEDYEDKVAGQLEKLRLSIMADPRYSKLSVWTREDEGYLHSSVRNVAEADGVDLVVMGTKGSSGMADFLVGSNTEKVIRMAPCPVLAVPEGVTAFDPKVVLLPSTLKKDQMPAFRCIADLERSYQFLVKVLYLNNASSLPTDGEAEATKNRMAKEAGMKKTDVIMTTHTLFEDNAILGAADMCDADLIVMATHQRQGLSHLLFGSITEDTVNHSHIPVLAVPVGLK
ncbi:MAG TPA: universal stress protein [Saprospiraceae bacterium]|nr:universal stress protein [Saprospiraceae bacterium]